MMKMEAGIKTYFEWISENLKSGDKIGVDPSQIASGITFAYNLNIAGFKNRSKYFKEKGLEMVTITENLVDTVWGADKPPMPEEKVFVHEVKYSGITV